VTDLWQGTHEIKKGAACALFLALRNLANSKSKLRMKQRQMTNAEYDNLPD
jgi:hypothetical protein